MDDARERKLAQNEALARAVNEEVEKLVSVWADESTAIELICECSLATCSERIHVPRTDYHRTRESPVRFLVCDEHVVEEIEDRIGTAGDATVVEKRGEGRDVAIQEA